MFDLTGGADGTQTLRRDVRGRLDVTFADEIYVTAESQIVSKLPREDGRGTVKDYRKYESLSKFTN